MIELPPSHTILADKIILTKFNQINWLVYQIYEPNFASTMPLLPDYDHCCSWVIYAWTTELGDFIVFNKIGRITVSADLLQFCDKNSNKLDASRCIWAFEFLQRHIKNTLNCNLWSMKLSLSQRWQKKV